MDELAQRMERRLAAVFGFTPERAAAVVAEVFDGLDDTVDGFVAARHDALQRQGLKNEAIYGRLREELAAWRFRAEPLTDRQIRRRIYG